ncbi:tetratricopeptide repeat protein [Vibrio sp. T187]|uniref:tetratricopeptide repeat protein n=1 Tax=Vibrio TaxID=662 RepID=UPI0010C9CE92|nr:MULTISPECIES: tetratricopeptide repeat protein [Vibrio]MBW3698473.1 tetratricopeptide repeat protein [Vibrio sp. T187]
MKENKSDEDAILELVRTNNEIKKILNRAYPEPDTSLGHSVYIRIQFILKYLGIPALVMAAIVPVYDFGKGLRNNILNDLIIETYTSYSVQLLKNGKPDRAEKVILGLEHTRKSLPRVHYAKARISVKQAIMKGANVDETEDIINILLILNSKSNFITGKYGDESDLLSLKLMLAEMRIASAEYEGAIKILSELESYEYIPSEMEAELYLKKATIHVWRNEFDKAEGSLLLASEILDEIGGFDDLAAEIVFQKAKNDQFQGKYDEAISEYIRSDYIFKDIGYNRGRIKSLNNLGMIYSLRLYEGRDLYKASQYYLKSLDLAKTLKDDVSIARANLNIAQIKHKEGKLQESLQRYILALEFFSSAKNSYGMSISHSGLGMIYDLTGNEEKYYYHAMRAFDGFVSLKYLGDIGKHAGHVADAANALGNNKDFVIYDYLSLVYRRYVNDPKWENNFNILKSQKVILGKETFYSYIEEAKNIAIDINLKLRITDIDLSISLHE